MKSLPLICLLAGYSSLIFAQKPGKSGSFGIGLEGGVSPDIASTQYANLGVTARYSIHAGPGYVYIGTGYMFSRVATDFQIPLRAGYKFIFSKQFFIKEELGLYYYKNPDGYSDETTQHGLSIATSIGVQFGIFDLGLQYDAIVNQNNFSTVGFLLGWNF